MSVSCLRLFDRIESILCRLESGFAFLSDVKIAADCAEGVVYFSSVLCAREFLRKARRLPIAYDVNTYAYPGFIPSKTVQSKLHKFGSIDSPFSQIAHKIEMNKIVSIDIIQSYQLYLEELAEDSDSKAWVAMNIFPEPWRYTKNLQTIIDRVGLAADICLCRPLWYHDSQSSIRVGRVGIKTLEGVEFFESTVNGFAGFNGYPIKIPKEIYKSSWICGDKVRLVSLYLWMDFMISVLDDSSTFYQQLTNLWDNILVLQDATTEELHPLRLARIANTDESVG